MKKGRTSRAVNVVLSTSIGFTLSCLMEGASENHVPREADPPTVLPPPWGPAVPVCGAGTWQAPRDLSPSPLVPGADRPPLCQLAHLVCNYYETPIHLVHHGHTVAMEYEPGSTIRLQARGPFYQIVHCHWHAPAAHTFTPGVRSAMELHIVHRSQADAAQLAVVVVIMQEGAENPVLRPMFAHLAEIRNVGDLFEDYTQLVNLADVLPADRCCVTYQDTRSTPSGAARVQWLVLRQPITVSRAQIEAFRAVQADALYGHPPQAA